ncbi:MAG: DHH family phosphoesterase [Oscillospiraceae bacterium]|nr:DHH family phosphoesterase [Oscillospiraceae bacterium]
MKKRIWTLSPWFIIFSVLMLGMSLISYRYNRYLCYIELGISVVSAIIVFAASLRFKRYIRKALNSALSNLDNADRKFIERFKMPVVVVGDKGDIIWSNSFFSKSLCMGRNPLGDNIEPYISGNSLDFMADMGQVDVSVDGKYFTVYCVKTNMGYVCQYIDNTYFKTAIKEFKDAQPSLALVLFDNREDFVNDNEEESARIVLSVESTLQRWAASYNALYKKLSGNRYLIIMGEKELEKNIQQKFQILKEIRHIKLGTREATISMGIGSGSKNLKDCEKKARTALDMALGRGGDQVALMKDNDTYEFFGGVSSGVEKLSKVRTRVIANTLAKAVTESDKVFIMGHRFSDLDCVGAAIGLQKVIGDTFKKYSRIVIDEGRSMASALINYVKEQRPEDEIFISPKDVKGVTPKTLLIIVDTHTTDFLESEEVYNKCSRIVVIDHHRKMVNFIKNALVLCIEPNASSASEMCTEIITYIGDSDITSVEAEALLSGIVLDTKNFVMKTGVRTFEAAAYLRKKSANTVTVKRFFSDNIETYKEKYNIVSHAEIVSGCAVSVTDSSIENIRLVASQAADELLMITDVYASFVLFETPDGVINVSARSYGKINVQIIMERLGGGGHQNMAAAQIRNSDIQQVKQQLISVINDVLSD